jgi:hypothetical protein
MEQSNKCNPQISKCGQLAPKKANLETRKQTRINYSINPLATVSTRQRRFQQQTRVVKT